MSNTKEKFSNWLISEKVIMSVIILNSLIIFLMAFPSIAADKSLFFWLVILDEICIIYFIAEVTLKIKMKGFKKFWSRIWDKFDLILVIITLPMLLQIFIPGLMEPHSGGDSEIFRKIFKSFMLLRLIRLLKLMKFIPNSTMLIEGIKRALKASIGVIMSLFILNMIFALGATILFDNIKGAEPFFGDPLNSMYTMFKIFAYANTINRV